MEWDHKCYYLHCKSEAQDYLKQNPQRHLIGTAPEGKITAPFQHWQAKTARLVFVAIAIVNQQTASHATVLGLTEIDKEKKIIRTWIILDKDQKMIELYEKKFSTLPAEYVMDQEQYERLAGFTYRLTAWDSHRGLSPRMELLETHAIVEVKD